MQVRCRLYKFVPQIFIVPYVAMHKVLECINKIGEICQEARFDKFA